MTEDLLVYLEPQRQRVQSILPTGVFEPVPQQTNEVKLQAKVQQAEAVILANEHEVERPVAAWPIEQLISHLNTTCYEVQVMIDVMNHLLDPSKGLLMASGVVRSVVPVQKQLRDLQLKRATQRQHMNSASSVLLNAAEHLSKALVADQIVEKQALSIRNRWSLRSRGQTGAPIYVDYAYRRSGSSLSEPGEADLIQDTTDMTNSRVLVRLPENQVNNTRLQIGVVLPGATTSLPTPLLLNQDDNILAVHKDLLRAQQQLFETDVFVEITREARTRRNVGIGRLTESQLTVTVDSLPGALSFTLVPLDTTAEVNFELTGEQWLCASLENVLRRKLLATYRKRVAYDPLSDARPPQIISGDYLLDITGVLRQYHALQTLLSVLELFGSSQNLEELHPFGIHVIAMDSPIVHTVVASFTARNKHERAELRLYVRDGVVRALLPSLTLVRVRLDADLGPFLADLILRVRE